MSLNDPQWGKRGSSGGPPDLDEIWRNVNRRLNEVFRRKGSPGDEAPGGDNPTPDQDIVDDIGRALGVQYQDNEELRASDKVAARDRHRWELDPASAEDYKDRK